jgi:hypothetical protein
MLLAVVFCVCMWALEFYLCRLSVARHVLFWLASLALALVGSMSGFKFRLRRSLLADFIAEQLFGVHFDDASRRTLRALDADEHRYVFGCHPHGTHCTHMLRLAGFGSALPESLGARLHIVVYWAYLVMPFLNVFYECAGMMPNLQCAMNLTLACGGSFAVCPDGVDGKWRATDRVSSGSERRRSTAIDVHRRSSKRLGFISLAARNGAYLVPLLSVNEHQAYDVLPGRLALGRWCILPLVERMEMRVGAPIATTGFDYKSRADMLRLADTYYEALARLGAHDYHVRLIAHTDDAATPTLLQ